MATRKIRGGRVVTSQVNQELIDDGNDSTVKLLESVSIENLGSSDIHCRINKGDEILIKSGETLSIGVQVDSIIVKEINSDVRYLGVD